MDKTIILRLATRLCWSAVTLLGTATLIFLLTNAIPGDVARIVAGSKASPKVLEDVRVRLHLKDPLGKRYGYYLAQLAHGDLGQSFVTDQPVSQAIFKRFPTTAALSALAVVMWMIVAVPLGVLTARWRGGWFDRTVLVLATVTLSLPAFWLARMLQYTLSYQLGWFPVARFHKFADLLLPATTLAILFAGYYARLIHTNMVEALDGSYITAARAKGLSERAVLFRHALRNALIPVVTILGMDIAALLGGVLFTEMVFALPGIGTLALQSVFTLDVPMIMGTVMFSAVIVVAANFVVDILYRRIDPRIRDGH